MSLYLSQFLQKEDVHGHDRLRLVFAQPLQDCQTRSEELASPTDVVQAVVDIGLLPLSDAIARTLVVPENCIPDRLPLVVDELALIHVCCHPVLSASNLGGTRTNGRHGRRPSRCARIGSCEGLGS